MLRLFQYNLKPTIGITNTSWFLERVFPKKKKKKKYSIWFISFIFTMSILLCKHYCWIKKIVCSKMQILEILHSEKWLYSVNWKIASLFYFSPLFSKAEFFLSWTHHDGCLVRSGLFSNCCKFLILFLNPFLLFFIFFWAQVFSFTHKTGYTFTKIE